MEENGRPYWTPRRVGFLALGAAAAFGTVAALRRLTAPPPTPGDVRRLDLDAGAFPGQAAPDAVVVIPPGFDPQRPLHVWVYFRGFSNCAENVVASADGACTIGGPARNASRLAEQLAASGANAVLVVPELRFDARSSDAGALERSGGFARMMDEILGEHLAPVLGHASLASVARLGVMAHSGGYLAAAAVVRDRPAALRSVVLLDALYAADGTFASWVEQNAAGFTPSGGYRFADVYTRGGGTADRSRTMIDRLTTSLTAAGVGASLFSTSGAQSLSDADLAAHAVVFQQSRLGHDEVAREMPQRFWKAGW